MTDMRIITPVLYETDTVDFSSAGICSLTDALSCSVHEERNGEFELSLTYPISGNNFEEIQLRRIIVAKPDPYSHPQPFRIYQISKPLLGSISVSARHISYDLSGYQVVSKINTSSVSSHNLQNLIKAINEEIRKPYNLPRSIPEVILYDGFMDLKSGKYYREDTEQSEDPNVIYFCIQDYAGNSTIYCPLQMLVPNYVRVASHIRKKPSFSINYIGRNRYDNLIDYSQIFIANGSIIFPRLVSVKDFLIGTDQNSVLNVLNSQINLDSFVITSKIIDTELLYLNSYEVEWDNWNVILHEYRGCDRGYSIRYRKNLIDFMQEEDANEIWSGIHPYVMQNDSPIFIQSDNGIVYCEDVLGDKAANVNPERILLVDLTNEYNSIPDPDPAYTKQERFLQLAKIYIVKNNIGNYNFSLTVSFLDKRMFERYENLSNLQKVQLCDLVHVDVPIANASLVAEVTSVTYNVLTGKYDEVQLGAPRSSLVSTIVGETISGGTLTKIPFSDYFIGYSKLNDDGKLRLYVPRSFGLNFDIHGQYQIFLSDGSVSVSYKDSEYFELSGPANTFFTWEIYAIDGNYTGLKDNPFPYNPPMTLLLNKYYTQNGVLYQCINETSRPWEADLSSSISSSFVKQV